MQNSKAIVTLVLGEKYLNAWEKYCRTNWQKYADKHGFDLIVIKEVLDTSERARKRSPSWQKLLILSQEFSTRYSRIVWIDADIVINGKLAPDITESVPLDKVGVAEEMSIPSPELHREALRRACELWGWEGMGDNLGQEYYRKMGFPVTFERVVQCGVLVLSPAHHRELLEKVYREYEDQGDRSYHMEQPALSYELLNANAVYWIDPRFNQLLHWQIILYFPFLYLLDAAPGLSGKLKRATMRILESVHLLNVRKASYTAVFLASFFLHVGGFSLDVMDLIDTTLESWRDDHL